MLIDVLRAKIAHATITQSELHYEGSITIDEQLIQAAGLVLHERVEVLNVNNGNRFATYVIKGEKNSGVICLNGPAARMGMAGDRIMILSYAAMPPEEAVTFRPKIIHLNDRNQIKN
jgi:aspartate 1-decarboxylase